MSSLSRHTDKITKDSMARLEPWTLRDGVAVITGAASGIGAALALNLARRGVHLALVDLNVGGLEATAAQARAVGVNVTTHALDVADNAAVAALPAAAITAHGRVSVLVNNAGVALGGLFEQVSAEDFDWLMNINFGATVRLTRAFLPALGREKAAQLVNVSSIFGIIAPPGQTAYSASKFAVRGFSESLRHELEMSGSAVGVTIVHPGGVRTSISENARLAQGLAAADVARERANWRSLLVLSPDKAAETIARAIERRERRVLVGNDAKGAALLQRLLPVSYWKHVARDIARRTRLKSA
jgi:short-subunit dehydrogenase